MRNALTVVLVVVALSAMAEHELAPAPVPPATAPRTGAQARSLRYTIPVCGVRAIHLKSTFNEGRAGHIHHAIDILAPRGTPVIAAVDGSVRKLFFSRAGGITLYEFDAAGTTSYYYAHLDAYAAGIHEGMPLHRGELIGYVGTTGNAPPGTPHLHFAIETLPPTKEWWKGTPVDPYPILVASGVTESAPR